MGRGGRQVRNERERGREGWREERRGRGLEVEFAMILINHR